MTFKELQEKLEKFNFRIEQHNGNLRIVAGEGGTYEIIANISEGEANNYRLSIKDGLTFDDDEELVEFIRCIREYAATLPHYRYEDKSYYLTADLLEEGENYLNYRYSKECYEFSSKTTVISHKTIFKESEIEEMPLYFQHLNRIEVTE